MASAIRKSRIRSQTLAWTVFCLSAGFSFSVQAADNVWSVQKLNDSKPWDRFVESPISIRVEGRIGGFGGGLFRLQHCDVKFTVDSAKLKLVPANSVVEVRGRFKKEGAKIEFAAEDIKAVPGYVEQFEIKSSKLRRPKPEDWIELGDWMTERATLYDDEDLRTKANEAYTNAIEVEYKSLKSTDFEGRFALAKKFESYKLSERRRMELFHEGLRIQWQSEKAADSAKLRVFAGLIEQQLPGSMAPLKSVDAKLKERYEQDPVATYRTADDKSRIQLHRLFHVAVTRKFLMLDAASDGRNGDAIADEIDNLIPEEHALAEKQRGLRLSFRLAHISTATQAEAQNLAAAYGERKQVDESRQALLQWIKAHEARLKGDGVPGLMRLADEYVELLHDQATAVEFLKEAHKIDPTFEDVKTRLNAMGYQWKGSTWVKSSVNQRNQMIPAGQSPAGVYIGMTATELRTYLGQPPSLARAITARGITEIWSFGLRDSSPLVIRLEQTGRDAEPKVKAIPGQ